MGIGRDIGANGEKRLCQRETAMEDGEAGGYIYT